VVARAHPPRWFCADGACRTGALFQVVTETRRPCLVAVPPHWRPAGWVEADTRGLGSSAGRGRDGLGGSCAKLKPSLGRRKLSLCHARLRVCPPQVCALWSALFSSNLGRGPAGHGGRSQDWRPGQSVRWHSKTIAASTSRRQTALNTRRKNQRSACANLSAVSSSQQRRY
jgi:hypothetical protein